MTARATVRDDRTSWWWTASLVSGAILPRLALCFTENETADIVGEAVVEYRLRMRRAVRTLYLGEPSADDRKRE